MGHPWDSAIVNVMGSRDKGDGVALSSRGANCSVGDSLNCVSGEPHAIHLALGFRNFISGPAISKLS